MTKNPMDVWQAMYDIAAAAAALAKRNELDEGDKQGIRKAMRDLIALDTVQQTPEALVAAQTVVGIAADHVTHPQMRAVLNAVWATLLWARVAMGPEWGVCHLPMRPIPFWVDLGRTPLRAYNAVAVLRSDDADGMLLVLAAHNGGQDYVSLDTATMTAVVDYSCSRETMRRVLGHRPGDAVTMGRRAYRLLDYAEAAEHVQLGATYALGAEVA